MGVPVFLMGASYPFVMALVARRLETLGRRTGLLMAANICGNVLGSLAVGFFLIEHLGTSGTLRLLSAVLLVAGWAAALLRPGRGRAILAAGATAAMAALLVVFPSNFRLWGFLHSAGPERFVLREERTCVNSLVRHGEEEVLYLNATSQNGYPYDDFHILIGWMPALMHEAPERALAVGLGIGSTAYGLLQDDRIKEVDCAELCRGERDLIAVLAERGSIENRQLLEDPRMKLHFVDGRKFLLRTDQPYDVITVDALRPNTAYSGNVYSLEFYQLVRSRLNTSGLFSQWVPTARVWNGAAQVFEHVALATVPGDRGSFLIASPSPLRLDRARALQKLSLAAEHVRLKDEHYRSLRRFFETVELQPVRSGGAAPKISPHAINRDLRPRDEYFLNNR
jgi:spermidine synthase